MPCAGFGARYREYRYVLLRGTPLLWWRGYPCASSASPTPPVPSARDTHTPLPATPTSPAPSLAGYPYTSAGDPHLARAFGKGYSYASAGIPHPSRAFGAPPPPPLGGGVRAWRYQVSSRVRLFSGISPCTGPCGYRHGGRGRRGGGTSSPSPVSNAPRTPNISPTLSEFLVDGYPRNSPATPTPPAPS